MLAVRRFSCKFLLAATLVPALAQSPDADARVQVLERRLAADHKLLNDWAFCFALLDKLHRDSRVYFLLSRRP